MPLIELDVPYEDKDRVHALGARWDAANQAWYVPEDANLAFFSSWFAASQQGRANIRAMLFGVALSETCCWKCATRIPVACLVVGPYHQRLEGCDGDGAGHWKTVDTASVLGTVTGISLPSLMRVLSVAPWLRMTYSATVGDTYLANICSICEALQGDFALHNEPDGTFYPQSGQARRYFLIQWFETPLYACAGDIGMGYEWL